MMVRTWKACYEFLKPKSKIDVPVIIERYLRTGKKVNGKTRPIVVKCLH